MDYLVEILFAKMPKQLSKAEGREEMDAKEEVLITQIIRYYGANDFDVPYKLN